MILVTNTTLSHLCCCPGCAMQYCPCWVGAVNGQQGTCLSSCYIVRQPVMQNMYFWAIAFPCSLACNKKYFATWSL